MGPFHGRYDAYVVKKRRPVLFGCWGITAGARDANQASRAAPFKYCMALVVLEKTMPMPVAAIVKQF